MGKAIGQYTQEPEILARFLFFSEFKQLVPEAIEDLKNCSLKYREDMCYFLIWRGSKTEEYLDTLPIEHRDGVRRLIFNSGDLVQEAPYQKLEAVYYESLEDWARRWNLAEDQWESNQKWIIYQAAREIDLLIAPDLYSAFSRFEPTLIYKAELIESFQAPQPKHRQFYREQTRRMFSPEEMEKIYGPDWRKIIERDGQPWEETVELMCMPTADEDPALFHKLLNKIVNMLPDHHPIFVPNEHEFFCASRGWNPCAESRSDAAKRLKEEFEKHLEGHLNLKEAEAKANGLQPIPSTLRRKLQKDRLRFEWLICYQTQHWSKRRIAEHYGVDRNAVQESLKTEAKLIGLKLSEDTTNPAHIAL